MYTDVPMAFSTPTLLITKITELQLCACGYLTNRSLTTADISTDVWFRIQVKSVHKNDGQDYRWHEPTICVRMDKEQSTVVCIGADQDFERLLLESLHRIWKALPPSNPWLMIVIVLEALVALHDEAVWLIRDIVRDVEKVRRLTA